MTSAPNRADEYGMTVGQLKKILADVPDNLLVILQKDAEGNGYGPLSGVESTNSVFAEGEYGDEEVYFKKLTGALKSQGYTEEDIYQGTDGIDCVVLWPIG